MAASCLLTLGGQSHDEAQGMLSVMADPARAGLGCDPWVSKSAGQMLRMILPWAWP